MQITRGMRRQSEKLARRRSMLPLDALVAGVDLGKRESVVVFIAAADRRRLGTMRMSTERAGVELLRRRADELAHRHVLGPLVVAMEPTSHFWKPVARALEADGVGYVLVQSFVVSTGRELDNLTRDKTDARDAGLIADLAAELRFTETRLPAGPWAEMDLRPRRATPGSASGAPPSRSSGPCSSSSGPSCSRPAPISAAATSRRSSRRAWPRARWPPCLPGGSSASCDVTWHASAASASG